MRAFKLNEDGECAVIVRKGSEKRSQQTVNYHPRAIEKFRVLVKTPPSKLTDEQQKILKRVSTRLKPTST